MNTTITSLIKGKYNCINCAYYHYLFYLYLLHEKKGGKNQKQLPVEN